jgi:hypothetical protein
MQNFGIKGVVFQPIICKKRSFLFTSERWFFNRINEYQIIKQEGLFVNKNRINKIAWKLNV